MMIVKIRNDLIVIEKYVLWKMLRNLFDFVLKKWLFK